MAFNTNPNATSFANRYANDNNWFLKSEQEPESIGSLMPSGLQGVFDQMNPEARQRALETLWSTGLSTQLKNVDVDKNLTFVKEMLEGTRADAKKLREDQQLAYFLKAPAERRRQEVAAIAQIASRPSNINITPIPVQLGQTQNITYRNQPIQLV